MAETPFIDILNPTQLAVVSTRSRGSNRPSYYDSNVAQAEEASEQGTTAGLVQISLDFEAVLILLPGSIKREVKNFIVTAGEIATNFNEDDFQLMTEVVVIRRNSYSQIVSDVSEKVLEFDAARAKMIQFIENTARGNLTVPKTNQNIGTNASNDDNSNPDTAAVTAIVLPNTGVLFASLQDAYSALSKPDDLAVHDRVSDAGILYTVQNAALERSKELLSWSEIFQTYLG